MITVRIQALSAGIFALVSASCAASVTPTAKSETATSESAGLETHGAELSAVQVVQHLRGNEADLRRCFFANPSLRGAVRFSWQLDVNGTVHRVRRESSTLSDARVESCIGERLNEIRFGDLEAPASERWTFVFRLVDPPKATRSSRVPSKKRKLPNDERGVVVDPSSAGTLPTDAIDNVVEAGYPLFARCYRDGVSRNNDLDGNVRLHFVVSAAGAVSEVSDGGSDLTDRQVVDCIAEGFYALRFPAPQHGSVSVSYRIGFDAG